ncbi:MAG: MarR family winged helix-turn-helix transcriptional regulator [Rhodocyclaceae bacterium]|nr:MarR family winged helix-turn-helix transcriptional regulator [Rhodocyclaceae bacterium]
MASNHNGMTERILDHLRVHGPATRRALRDALGVRLGNINALLERHIDAGLVLIGRAETGSSVICYRLNAQAPAGIRPAGFSPTAATRTCLSCGNPFHSSGPMNRMCYACRRSSADVSPFAC